MSDFSGQSSARKEEIRARLLAARRTLTPAQRRAAALSIQATAVTMVTDALVRAGKSATGGPPTVAGYVPFGSEPGGVDLPAVLARALPPGGRLLLPVLREDRDLDWAVHGDLAFPPLPQAAIRDAALVIVPALAVDRRGVRLGRGGGSYDRALARVAAGTPVVALLYDGELWDEPLPADPHDRPVTAVVTPALGHHPIGHPPIG